MEAVDIHSDDSVFGSSRLGLPMGRNGMVIPVHEEEVASMIAYSLSSEGYQSQFSHYIQEFLQDQASTERDATRMQKGKDFHHGQDFYNPDTLGSSDSAMQGDVSYAVKAQDSLPGSSASYETNDRTKDDGTGGAKATMADKETVAKGAADEDLLASVNNEHLLTYSTLRDIKHRFHDRDESGHVACNFSVTTHCALQFEAVRRAYFEREAAVRAFALAQKDSIYQDAPKKKSSSDDEASPAVEQQPNYSNSSTSKSEENDINTPLEGFNSATDQFVRSLSVSSKWSAQGGKSGASFAKSKDGRFVCKVIAGVELKMFLHFARAYFEYMANAFYNDLPTLCVNSRHLHFEL